MDSNKNVTSHFHVRGESSRKGGGVENIEEMAIDVCVESTQTRPASLLDTHSIAV